VIEVKTLKGSAYYQTIYFARKWSPPVCPLCRKQVHEQCAHIVITNNKLFPNVVVHETCYKVPDKQLVLTLQESYKWAKEAREQVAAWFPRDKS
jgi:hypothetical protein